MDKLSHIEETCSGENWRSQPEDWSPTSVSIVSSATLDNISFSGCDNHAYCTFCKDNSWCEYVVETVAPSVLSDYDTIIAAGYGPLAMSLLAQLSDVCSAINSLSDDVVATIDGTSSKTHGPSARPSAPPSTSQMSPSSRPSAAPLSSSTHAPTTVLETQSGKSQDHSRSTSHWRRWLVIGGICGAVILMGFVHLFREKSGEKSADYKRISYDEPKPGKSNYYQHEAAWREKRKNERRTWREAGRPSSTYGLT